MDSDINVVGASRRRRGIAAVIDSIPFAPIAVAFVRKSPGRRMPIEQSALLTVLRGGYLILAMATTGGSLGQLALGLRVVDAESGRRASWRQSALRWAVGAAPGLVLRLATWVAIGKRSEKRRDQARTRWAELERSDEPVPFNAGGGLVPAIGAVVIAYQMTVGRHARDRISRTRVVRISR